MRLPVKETASKGAFRLIGVMALTALLPACGMIGGGGADGSLAAALPANGPQADYPVEIGEPYQIGGVTYRPADTLNYDEVGYLTEDRGAMGFTGSHHTLPVPSYAEVTSLASGRTILVRLERRGPMRSNHLLALSPAALAQLGASAETPIRLRRVNAPEEQRVLLRSGQSAPLRMDTPMSLVNVLRRRLPDAPTASATPAPALANASAPEPASLPPAVATATIARGGPPPLRPIERNSPAPAPAPIATQAPAPTPAAPPAARAAQGGFVVQAAAFSSEERARRAATALGGTVSRAGNLWRVRTGPFPTRGAAEASLANVRAAGYSDARIFSDG